MRELTATGFVTILFILAGCAAFTPYESDFTCPKTFNGKCVSTKTAYEESLDGGKNNGAEEDVRAEESVGGEGTGDEENPKRPDPEHAYFDALIEKLTGILKEPKTPVVAPPQVLRILVLPYEGENAALYMPRYIYLIVDEAHWVLENRLSEDGAGKDETVTGKRSFPLR